MSDDHVFQLDTGKGVRLTFDIERPDEVIGSLYLKGKAYRASLVNVIIHEDELSWFPDANQLEQLRDWARVLFPGAVVAVVPRNRAEATVMPEPVATLS